jgi:hypothetical protein
VTSLTLIHKNVQFGLHVCRLTAKGSAVEVQEISFWAVATGGSSAQERGSGALNIKAVPHAKVIEPALKPNCCN